MPASAETGSTRRGCETYNELFADLMVSLAKGDADAIYKSISFPGESEEANQNRRFSVETSVADADLALKTDAYGVFSPIKPFIWRRLTNEYRREHPEVSLGEVGSRVLDAMLRSMVDVTKDFTVPRSEISGAAIEAEFPR